MTNRQYTSRDVACRFGKQFICRQIFNGLLFVYVKRWKVNNVWHEEVFRGETGFVIKSLQNDNSDFKKHFFGARENVSDSYYVNKLHIVVGLTGLFCTDNGLILGRVEEDEERSLVLQQFKFVENVFDASSWLQGVQSDSQGNLVIKPIGRIPVLNTFKCKEVMDFGFKFNGQENSYVVNVSKFGTFWSLVCNTN